MESLGLWGECWCIWPLYKYQSASELKRYAASAISQRQGLAPAVDEWGGERKVGDSAPPIDSSLRLVLRWYGIISTTISSHCIVITIAYIFFFYRNCHRSYGFLFSRFFLFPLVRIEGGECCSAVATTRDRLSDAMQE